VSRFPAAVRLPAFASRPSHSRRNSALLTVGLPAKRPDPDGVTAFRTHESRPGWELSLARGQRCSSRLERVPNWRPPHSQRPVPAHRHNNPSCGSLHHEASTRVQAIHPSGVPLGCDPRMGRERLGFSPSFAPRRPAAERPTSRRGQATEHGPGTTLTSHQTNLQPRVHSYRATSRRTARCRAGRHHARHAGREIRAGPAPDPIAGSRAAVGTGGSRLKRSWRRGSPLRVSEGQSDRDCSVGDNQQYVSAIVRRLGVRTHGEAGAEARAARARRSKMGGGRSQHGELYRCACMCVLVG
jgi:hypothetical protein